MNPKVIIVDGKTYHSVDEMPPDVRQKYEQAMRILTEADGNQLSDVLGNDNILADQNKNGVPDILENITTSNVTVKTAESMKFIVDGKEFHNLDDLPPDARARYEQAMGKLDKNGNGIPDFVEGMINATNSTTNISTGFGTQVTARPTAPAPVAPVVTPEVTPDTDISNGRTLLLIGLLLFLVCAAAAAGVWYFYLR